MTSTGSGLSEDEGTAPTGALTNARNAATETVRALASVFKNPNLRRIQLAFAGSAIGDWAYATAVTVWAYGVGGPHAIGIWVGIRLALIAITAPLTSTLADRFPRKRVMVVSDLARVVLVTASAVCLFLETSPAPIFVLATLTALFSTPFMIAQRAMLPSLADRPEELTAANGTASTIDSLAFFIGPAIGALMLGVTTVQVVFLLNVATFAWSLLLVSGVNVVARADAIAGQTIEEDGDREGTGPVEAPTSGFLSETMAGFRTIIGDRGLLVVVVAVCMQTVVAGASAVFMVVMMVEIVGTGPEGVGFLESVLGVGSVVGGFVAISRAARHRLGGDLLTGVVMWAAPLLLVTAWPSPVVVFVAVALLGVANPLVDVNTDTILQRLAPDQVLGRVFGALESACVATMALGAFAMPFLIEWLGLRWALAAVAVPVAVVALAGLPTMRALDARLRPPLTLPLLQAIEMFGPLDSATVESLARSLVASQVPAGEVVVREGEASDRFYVVESGLVEVTQAGRVLRQEGPGEFFGEIGLLRDVPRTATITAVEDTVLQALSREDFLDAVTGQREARSAADTIVNRRLAA